MSKAKGTTLIGAVKSLRKRKDEARKVLPESMHHYLSDRVLTSGWYPEEHLLGLIRALLEITPGRREDALRLMGVATASSMGEGVYSHLLAKSGSSSTTFALWSSMHDTGTLKSWRDAENGTIFFELRDYANPSPEMCAITTAFIVESMRMGGHTVALEVDCCVLDGGDCCRWKTA